MSNYGVVEFKGNTYNLLCDAWVDNYGTEGCYRYYAKAEKDGKNYLVTWNTTQGWDKANELFSLEEKLSHEISYPSEKETVKLELEKEIKELEDEGINSFYADQSNACDWENPISVERID